jgi:predicted  nucleic acid-binding Zn-ribbon protein
MGSESFSFRITRSAEDLAQTTHALSQRLVTLEQRLETLELELLRLQDSADSSEPEQRDSLETVERLMHDCRSLLGLESEPGLTPSVSGAVFAEAA